MLSRLALLAIPFVLLTQAPAWADDDNEGPPPPPPAPPGAVYQPLYTAPLAQQTQTTYVPQSVALSGPEEITDVEDGQAVPLGYTQVHRARKGLIIGGAVTLGAVYGVCALTAAIGQDSRSYGETNPVAAMWIPVVGPFVQIPQTDSATARVFLVGLGGAQVAGALMLYYGLTTTKRVFVRNDLVGNMAIGPMVGNGASGLSLTGRF